MNNKRHIFVSREIHTNRFLVQFFNKKGQKEILDDELFPLKQKPLISNNGKRVKNNKGEYQFESYQPTPSFSSFADAFSYAKDKAEYVNDVEDKNTIDFILIDQGSMGYVREKNGLRKSVLRNDVYGIQFSEHTPQEAIKEYKNSEIAIPKETESVYPTLYVRLKDYYIFEDNIKEDDSNFLTIEQIMERSQQNEVIKFIARSLKLINLNKK